MVSLAISINQVSSVGQNTTETRYIMSLAYNLNPLLTFSVVLLALLMFCAMLIIRSSLMVLLMVYTLLMT